MSNIIDATEYFETKKKYSKASPMIDFRGTYGMGFIDFSMSTEHPLDELRYQGDEQGTTLFEMNFNKEFFQNVREEKTKIKSQFELQQEKKFKNLLQFPPLPDRRK